MLIAGLVAVLWSLNLSVAFPVVKVLLQGQSLNEYVEQEIATTSREIDASTAKIAIVDRKLDAVAGLETEQADHERVHLLKEKARRQSDLGADSRKALLLNWVKSYVISWLPADQFDLLALILGVACLATVLKGVLIFTQDVMVGSVVELSTMGVRKQCFRSTLALDYQTLSRAGTPELMSRFTNDMTVLSNGLNLLGGKVVREPLKAGTCLIGAFLVNWQLTLLSMLFVPLTGLVFYRLGRKLKQASHRVLESMSRLYKTLEETFDGLKVVIAFNGAVQHRRRFHRENKEYYRKAMKIMKIDALTSPTTELLGTLAASIALLPGTYLVLRGTTEIWGIKLASAPMDVAELTLLYVMLAGILDPMRKLSSVYAKLKRSTAAADRIFHLIDQKSLVRDPKKPAPFQRHTGSIVFEDICFSYSNSGDDAPARPKVLDRVSLKVDAGEVVVVVGENGSGKSTLVNLLPRYYDPDQGRVEIDGRDIREVRLRELRREIGVVTQETLLFDDTIAENIRYGRPEATREEIEKAAREAHVTDFLDGSFPDGFETRVGEKGQRLSGGQRQRIALARAMLRNPSILILDEATSAIDSHSELLIHQALRTFVKGRTTFIITHSVSQSILDFVSRIVVMERGRMIASGTHDEVIATCPIYQRLYQTQTRQNAESTSGRNGGSTEDATARAAIEHDGGPTPADQGDPDIIPLLGPHPPGRASGRYARHESESAESANRRKSGNSDRAG